MNRIIKFRGKRIDNGEWVYGHYFTTPLTDENSGVTQDKGWFFLAGDARHRHCINQNGSAYVIDEKTVGQFTGFLDKNGKEIYENDVLKCSSEFLKENPQKEIGEVFYHNDFGEYEMRGYFIIEGKQREWIGEQLCTYCGDFMKDRGYSCEVIGNIFDNPELMKPANLD